MSARPETSWGGAGYYGIDIDNNIPVVTEGGEGCPDGSIPTEDINTEADGTPVAKSE